MVLLLTDNETTEQLAAGHRRGAGTDLGGGICDRQGPWWRGGLGHTTKQGYRGRLSGCAQQLVTQARALRPAA